MFEKVELHGCSQMNCEQIETIDKHGYSVFY